MLRGKRLHFVVPALVTLGLAVFACSSSSTPQSSGDDVYNDTQEAGTTSDYDVFIPPSPPSDATFDTMMYGDVYMVPYEPDSYAPLAACDQCACGPVDGGAKDAAAKPPAYCFGGGTNMMFTGTCSEGDGTMLVVGCNPLPAACMNNRTCACILGALPPPTLGCYPVCAGVYPNFEVYCPNP